MYYSFLNYYPLGSGKSCLLNILSGRISCSRKVKPKLEGALLYDNQVVNYSLFRKQTAFIAQEDQLFPYLTVEETFLLAAYFNFPRNTLKAEVLSSVNLLITQLNLNKVRHTIIGSSSRRGKTTYFMYKLQWITLATFIFYTFIVLLNNQLLIIQLLLLVLIIPS